MGFTLVEILLVMAIGAMVMSALVPAIFQTIGVSTRNSVKIAALEDINTVARLLGNNARAASDTTLTDPSSGQSTLGLTWVTWYDEAEELVSYGIDHYCECTLLDGKVQIQYWEWDCDPLLHEEGYCDQANWWELVSPVSTTTAGKYIYAIEFSREGSIITATITSSPDGNEETAETLTYHYYVRIMEELVQ